jgi:hypothetical protein
MQSAREFLIVKSNGSRAWIKTYPKYPNLIDLDWFRTEGPTIIETSAYRLAATGWIPAIPPTRMWYAMGTKWAHSNGYKPVRL